MRLLVLQAVIVVGLGVGVGFGARNVAAAPPTSHEVIYTKPSGFWTSNRPAEGGSYRWRLLGIGAVILGITGYGMLRLIRRANADRERR